MKDITRERFGRTAAGEEVMCFTLTDGEVTARILDFGGAVQSLLVPGKDGRAVDVALGYDSVAAYEAQDKYLGALIGRCANRIARGAFTLGGKEVRLRCNNGRNHLHGGLGFDKRLWAAEITPAGLALSLHSADGDEGYPGALDVCVTYRVEGGALHMDYRATASALTVCNLTNHSYFNLAGAGSGSVGAQRVQLFCDAFTPIDAEAIPLGDTRSVEGTALDLRSPTRLDTRWDSPCEQLQNGGGFDHNFVVRGDMGVLRPVAEAWCDETGVYLRAETTLPGVQFYTANALEGAPTGKGGAAYHRRDAFCLETQFFPDAVHQPQWQQPTLRPGDVYAHQTVYRFRPYSNSGSDCEERRQ